MNYNVILHIDSGEEGMLRMVARNAANYLNALPRENFEMAIVANAAAVTLFTEEFTELKQLCAPLLERGVKIKICANAIAEHNLNPAKLWPGLEIVPAGLVEVVRLQREGFAYIKP